MRPCGPAGRGIGGGRADALVGGGRGPSVPDRGVAGRQIVGEPQVLGQVRAAHKLAGREGAVGPVLEAVLQAAYASAKRARTETAIAEGPVSMVAVAVDLVEAFTEILMPATARSSGQATWGCFWRSACWAVGCLPWWWWTGTPDGPGGRAELSANHAAIEGLADAMARADVLVTAVGGGRHVIDEAIMAATLKRRRRRPVMVVDLGIPSDVDPAVERLEDAYVYDLDDLERAALEGKATRAVAARQAEDLVAGEVSRFLAERASREAVPAIRRLRATFEGVRQGVLADRGEAMPMRNRRRIC